MIRSKNFNLSLVKMFDLNENELKRTFSIESELLLSIASFVWSYFIPLCCLLGILTNLLNVIIFSRDNLKNSIYKYLLAYSVADLLYMLISFAYFFGKYGFVANYYSIYSYGMRIFELYIFLGLATQLAVFMLLLIVLISLKRLIMVANYTTIKVHFKSSLFACLSFTLFLNYVFTFGRRIVLIDRERIKNPSRLHHNNTNMYEILPNEFASTQLFKLLISFASTLRGFILPCLLITLNTLMVYKYRVYLRKKRYLTGGTLNGS